MKLTNNKYENAITAITAAIAAFNAEFGGRMTVDPVVVINPKARKSSKGWFFSDKWALNKTARPELLISAEELAEGVEKICGNILHEMAHLLNAQAGVEDCSKLQYHNKSFKSQAESLGLICSKTVLKGFADTAVGQKAKDAIDKFIAANPEVHQVFAEFQGAAAPKAVYTKLYSIPANLDLKVWFENESARRAITQKELLRLMVESMKKELQQTATPTTETSAVTAEELAAADAAFLAESAVTEPVITVEPKPATEQPEAAAPVEVAAPAAVEYGTPVTA